MKKRYLLFALLLFIFMGKALAEEYVGTFDLSNEAVEYEKQSDGIYKMKINNLPTSNTSLHTYYLYLVNTATDPFNNDLLRASDETGCRPDEPTNRIVSGLVNISAENNVGNVLIPSEWYIYSKYDYAYLVYSYTETENSAKKTCKVSTSTIPLKKEENFKLPDISNRYSVSFALIDNQLHVFPKYPYNSNENSKEFDINVTTKVGLISDNELMNSLALDYNGNIDKLIQYAKNDTEGVIHNGSQPMTNLLDTDVTEEAKKLVAGSYYYIYNTASSTQVELRNLEGIIVTVGKPNGNGNVYLADFSEWDSFHASVDPTTQPEEANPKTGMFISIMGLIVLTGAVLVLLRKHQGQIYKI